MGESEKRAVTPGGGAHQTKKASRPEKYITFFLGREKFGINILQIQEIILPSEFRCTPIPNAPGFLRGILNLRGRITPLVNLRLKVGLDESPETETTRVIICKIEQRLVGIVVDALSQVVEIPGDRIEPMRSENSLLDVRHIGGVYKEIDRLIILINIASVVLSGRAMRPAAAINPAARGGADA